MSSLGKQAQPCRAVSPSCAQGSRADEGREVNKFIWGWKFLSGDERKTEGGITY